MNNSVGENLCLRCNCPVDPCWLFCPYCGEKIPEEAGVVRWGSTAVASWLILSDDGEPSVMVFPSILWRNA